MGAHQSSRPTTDVWLTPPHIIDELGGANSFDLDPCSPIDRPYSTAREHFTIRDNGLIKPWHGRVWLNPPYSASIIGQWMARMVDHGHGLALVFARTETAMFHRCVWQCADGLFFFAGRINFHLPDGRRAIRNAGAPNVLVAYGSDDADVLAACSLPGRFVPLTLRSMIAGYDLPRTWMEEVTDAMTRFGAAVSLDTIYRALASSSKAKRNPHYQAKIRQILQKGPFERVDRGVWRLI